MALDEAFAEAAADLLEEFGGSAVYTSQQSGEVPCQVDVERDVEVLDEAGAYVRRDLLTIASGLVKPSTEDIVELADGRRFRIEQMHADDGVLMQLRARPAS